MYNPRVPVPQTLSGHLKYCSIYIILCQFELIGGVWHCVDAIGWLWHCVDAIGGARQHVIDNYHPEYN